MVSGETRHCTLQVGNIATKVLWYRIWCANEVRTGLNFLLFIIQQDLNIFFTGDNRNCQTLDKWLKFIIPQYNGCMLKIEFKRAIFSQKCSEIR